MWRQSVARRHTAGTSTPAWRLWAPWRRALQAAAAGVAAGVATRPAWGRDKFNRMYNMLRSSAALGRALPSGFKPVCADRPGSGLFGCCCGDRNDTCTTTAAEHRLCCLHGSDHLPPPLSLPPRCHSMELALTAMQQLLVIRLCYTALASEAAGDQVNIQASSSSASQPLPGGCRTGPLKTLLPLLPLSSPLRCRIHPLLLLLQQAAQCKQPCCRCSSTQ